MLEYRIKKVKSMVRMQPGLKCTGDAVIELIDDLVEMLDYAEASPSLKLTIRINKWLVRRKLKKVEANKP